VPRLGHELVIVRQGVWPEGSIASLAQKRAGLSLENPHGN
jgi:hypothetical protein